jgi:superfamily I DNA/RNA helicase
MPHEFGLFVRSMNQLDRAQAAAKKAGLPFKVLDENVETTSGHISIGTMHLAKGLEFRAVAVMACDDEIIPLQERIETVGDDADLQEVYDTERHLLYVACTRGRDQLLVTGVKPVSEFLEDFDGKSEGRQAERTIPGAVRKFPVAVKNTPCAERQIPCPRDTGNLLHFLAAEI